AVIDKNVAGLIDRKTLDGPDKGKARKRVITTEFGCRCGAEHILRSHVDRSASPDRLEAVPISVVNDIVQAVLGGADVVARCKTHAIASHARDDSPGNAR